LITAAPATPAERMRAAVMTRTKRRPIVSSDAVSAGRLLRQR
jgi:hypothetical protein